MQKRYLILIMALLFLGAFHSPAHAGPWNGWVYQNAWPTANTLLGVKFVTPKKGWTVGQSGTILYTEDGGINWELQKSGTSEDLRAVAFVNEKEGWIVGNGGMIIRTEDGGKTWKKQGDVKVSLFKIFFVNEKEGWVGGSEGTLLHTTDGGNSWIKYDIKAWADFFRDTNENSEGFGRVKADIAGIFFRDTNTGWVLAQGRVFRTTDGGKSWDNSELPSVSLPGMLSVGRLVFSGWHGSLFFLNENKGFATVGLPFIFSTEDGGRTWQAKKVSVTVDRISFTGEKNGCMGAESILCTEDGGKTWKERLGIEHGIRVIEGYFIAIQDISFANKMDGWAVGGAGGVNEPDGQIMKTDDGGKTWKMISRSYPSWKRHFINEKTGWRVHNISQVKNGIDIRKGRIVRTDDGGDTWTVQNEFDTNINIFYRFFFLEPAKGWAVGTKIGRGRGGSTTFISNFILRTEDGGKKWITQYEEPAEKNDDFSDGLWDIYFINSNEGWAVGSKGRILHTKDGGKHWERQKSGTNLVLHDVFFSDAEKGIAIGDRSYFLGEDTETDKQAKGVVLYTEDGGRHWRPVWKKGQVLVKSIFFLDKGTGWISVETIEGSLLLTTRDGGKTWSEDNINATGRLYFLDKNRGAIFSDAEYISLTGDGGKTWEWQQPKPLYRYPRHISEIFKEKDK